MRKPAVYSIQLTVNIPMPSLRPATKADARTIRRMIYQAGINPTQLDWRRFILAVNEDGGVVGCAQVKPHGDGTRELASLVVVPQQRGQGIARLLIEKLLSQSQPPIYLTCRSSLIPFYEKFGFRELELAEMPPYFHRLANIVRSLSRLSRSPMVLAVMKSDQPTANG